MAADVAPAPVPVESDEGLVKRKKRRTGVRIDMTPMVDVAFLLLIFFMVTAVFRRPLAMEVNMPEPGAKVEVPESNVLTVFVDQDEDLFFRMARQDLQPVSWPELAPIFEGGQEANSDLIVLVKIHRRAPYDTMVHMMDTLDEVGMQRFSLVPMTDRDQETLEGAQ